MATIEQLPADQTAVLSLLLSQQKSYAEIAQALDLSEQAVSDRAYSALSSLAEPEQAPASKRRGELCDYLLGQQSDADASKTKQSLMRSAPDRAWARAAAAPLVAIASGALPAIPGAAAGGGRQIGDDGPSQEAAVGGGSRGGLLLLAGVGLVIALGVGFGLGRLTGGGDSSSSTTISGATNASSTKAAAVAQAALKPPAGAPAQKALGFAGISAQANQRQLSVVAKSLPTARSGSQYGVWLTANSKAPVWLGYLQTVGSAGGVGLQGTLNGDPKAYSGVLVTRESSSSTPTNPSTTYLVGKLVFAGS